MSSLIKQKKEKKTNSQNISQDISRCKSWQVSGAVQEQDSVHVPVQGLFTECFEGFNLFSKAFKMPKAWYLHTFNFFPMEMSIPIISVFELISPMFVFCFPCFNVWRTHSLFFISPCLNPHFIFFVFFLNVSEWLGMI